MELIVAEKINAIELFTGADNLDPFLKKIEDEVLSIVPDIETPQGRKEIASLAHKVSKSKVLLDNMGKDLVAGWKSKAKKVDASRKTSRDFLDNLKAKVRQPLTEFEEAEKAQDEAEKLKVELDLSHEEAHAENDLFNRQREVERKESELAAAEQARIERARIEQEQKETAEREERVRKEATVRAEKEAAEKVLSVEREILRVEADKEAAIKYAEEEKIRAAERSRIEKELAVKEANELMAAKEAARLAAEKAEKEAAEKKAANTKHRAKINNEVLRFIKGINGVTEGQAKGIIKAIANNEVPHLKILY